MAGVLGAPAFAFAAYRRRATERSAIEARCNSILACSVTKPSDTRLQCNLPRPKRAETPNKPSSRGAQRRAGAEARLTRNSYGLF